MLYWYILNYKCLESKLFHSMKTTKSLIYIVEINIYRDILEYHDNFPDDNHDMIFKYRPTLPEFRNIAS